MKAIPSTVKFLTVVAVLSVLVPHGQAGNTFSLTSCPAESIFDTASMSCVSCGSGLRVPNNRSLDAMGNAQECVCGSGSIVQPSTCSSSVLTGCAADTCSACPAGSAAAKSSPTTCLPCGSSTSGIDATTGDCTCGALATAGTHILVERNAAGTLQATKECLACPTGKRVFLTALPAKGIIKADPYLCQGCPNTNDENAYVTATGDCACNSGYRAAGVVGSFSWAGITCLPDALAGSVLATFPEASAVQVSYNSLELSNGRNKKASVSGKTSVTFQHLYASAAVNCLTRKPGSLQGNQACQALANLCVLQMYSPASTVCSLYQSIYNARKAAYNGFSGWPSNGLPFLSYSAAEVRAIVTTPETDNALTTSIMAFNTNKEATYNGAPTSDVLQFYLAKFSINGTFLGVERLTNQFDAYYCSSLGSSAAASSGSASVTSGSIASATGSRSTSPWLNFGTSHIQASTCDLSLLSASKLAQEPVFYDVYVRDSGADAAIISSAAAAKKNGWATSTGSGSSSSSSSSSRALGTLAINQPGGGLPLTLYPVPVVITNYQAADGSFPNANPSSTSSEADDVYARRFILAEAVSSITQVGSQGEILRYAANIRLSIRARADTESGSSKPNRLATPLLTITYKERLVSDINAAGAAADVSFANGPLTSKGLSTASITSGSSLSFSSPAAAVSAANSLSASLPMNYDAVTFAAEQYSTNNSEYGRVVMGLAIVLGMLVIGWAFVRVVGWTRMNARNQFEAALGCLHVAKLFQYLVTSFAPAFFWFLWIVGGLYWLVFFKLQTAVSIMLPPARPGYSDDPYQPFVAALCTVFACYIVRILWLLWYQVSVDVFFVDWEKPRGALVRMGADHEAALGKGVQPGMPGAVVSADSRFAPISIWRTLHAANEWSELQTTRRLHLPFVLLVLATIMQAGGLQYVAVARPGVNDLSPGPINPLLQFGNNIFWFLVVAGIQLLFTVLIYERYVGENPSSSFIDVCTVAKVSILIMDQKYHGYYLHCNAPHEHSDGSMAELGEHLFEEAAAMRVGRGLPGCPDASCQSFELHVPALWREMYDRVYRRLLEAEAQEALAASAGNTAAGAAQLQIQALQMQQAAQQQQRAGGGPSSTLALVNSNPSSATATSLTALSKVARVRDKTRRLGAAFAALTAFLKGFIEESDPDYRRQWRERTLPQQVFDLPPDMLGESLAMMGMSGGGAGSSGMGIGGAGSILPGGGGLGGAIGGMGGGGGAVGGGMGGMGIGGMGGMGSRSTIMMMDRSYRFERVMWRGIELDLLVWDMLVYCFTDYFQQSPTLAAVVTLVVNMALQWLRTQLGQRNIAKKTLVDERFLD